MINFNINIDQYNVLIVGSGTVAKRRLKKILSSSKKIKINLISPTTDQELNKILKDNKNIKFKKRKFKKSDIINNQIILACTNDSKVNEKISIISKEMKLLINDASNKKNSNFQFTSILKINSFLNMSLNSNGKNPSYSKESRILIEKIFIKSIKKLLKISNINPNKKNSDIGIKKYNSDIIKKLEVEINNSIINILKK